MAVCRKLLLLLLASNALAQLQAYNFYFLPPAEDEWMLGTPYLVWKEAGRDTMVKLSVDSRCGWYRYTFEGTIPDRNSWIWLNGNKKSGPDDQIGDKGLDEDPVDWGDGRPTPFNLAERFGEGENTLFFASQKGLEGWTANDPNIIEKSRCEYKFAAMIYHTNDSANTSFTLYGNRNQREVEGIVKGIAKPTLENGKIQFNAPQGTDWTEANFKKAFEDTPGTNVQRCFDMPFTRRSDLWEFDALRLCPDGTTDYSATNTCGAGSGGRIGAFYPPSLMKDIDEHGDYRERYSMMKSAERPFLCGTGNNNRCLGHNAGDAEDSLRGRRIYNAEMDVRPDACVNMWCFDRGWYGGNCGGNGSTAIDRDKRTDPARVGDLSWVTSGTTKEEIDSYMETICWKPFKAAASSAAGSKGDLYDYSHPAPMASHTPQGTQLKISSLMCFESAPATFIYTEGQEFFFRGDDDIWVFINNQLVVDLGGSHGPAPGYVNLDTIKVPEKLVPGKEYSINIFFCDRRSAGSNVRISTNMYFAQTNGLFVKQGDGLNRPAEVCVLQDGGAGSCSAMAEGSQATELCGNDVYGKIEFYLINRKGDDKRILKVPDDLYPDACRQIGDQKLLCYGGITVDMSDGTARVAKTDVAGLPGTWYLYAKVKEDSMKPPYPEDVKIATITSSTTVRMAWGDIKDGSVNGPTITDLCKNPSIAATGELVPVCFSGGDFSGDKFLMDDIEAIGGSIFKLDTRGFLYEGSRLKVFYDSLGLSPVKTDTTLAIPGGTGGAAKPNSGSKPGVLVLWVTGEYAQEPDTAYYKINVNGRPASEEVAIKSVIPKLEWIRVAGSDVAIPPNQQKGSKWIDGDPTKGVEREEGHPAPVWVGEVVKLRLRAQRDGKTCKTCNYDLILTAAAKAGSGANSSTYPEINDRLIVASGLAIKNGEAALDIAGKRDVLHPYYAQIFVRGVSPRSEARWDSLQFKEPPVPYPENVKIFDLNGDGIGDSLVIAYKRGFHPDSLPNAIQVQWAKDTTVFYGICRSSLASNGDTVYSSRNVDSASNIQYWLRYLKGLNAASLDARRSLTPAERKELRDTIILRRGPNKNEAEPDVRFSRSVLTKSETGKIANWVSFKTGTQYDIPLTGNIDDKIPAIIVSARYLADENNKGCGTSSGSPCRDKISLEFSEPVKIDPSASNSTDNEIKNTFAYMLRDIGESSWNVLSPGFLPSNSSMRYNVSKEMRPSEDGSDSMVTIYYNRYRVEGGEKSGTPMPGDSVKFAAERKYPTFARNILLDAKGNPPNPNEIGKQIEGRKPFTPEKIPIGEIDPTNPNENLDKIKITLKDSLKVGDYDEKALFNQDRPIELLPVPPDWTIRDVLREYPGTIGILLNPDVFNELADLEDEYCDPKGSNCISDGDITFYVKAFQHTNLGNYVANRGFSIKCDDQIFPRNASGQPSCRDSRSKFYIAWDMKDMKGRFVGAGAYVGLYDFRWEVHIKQDNKTIEKEKIERKVEMHGVKRVKKK